MHDGLSADEVRRAQAAEVDPTDLRREAIAAVERNDPEAVDVALAAWEAQTREAERLEAIRQAKSALATAVARNDRRAAQAARDRWKQYLPSIAEPQRDPQPLDVGELLLEPDVEPRWLCKAFGWTAGAPHLLAGYGGSGKTWALQAAAVAVALGRPIWGYYPCRRGRVLHLDYEQGLELTRRRYRRLVRGMGEELVGLSYARAHAGSWASQDGDIAITLGEGQADRWLRLCESYDLMLIDSLRVAVGAIDENDSRIRESLDLLGHVSERTGCVCVVVHHAKKNQGADQSEARFSVRGSSAIFDACASVMVTSARKGEPPMVSHEKHRDGIPLDDFALSLSDIERNGDQRWGMTVATTGVEVVHAARAAEADAKLDAKLGALELKALRALRSALPGGMSTAALRDALQVRGADAAAVLQRLVEAGSVSRESGARGAHLYRLRGDGA